MRIYIGAPDPSSKVTPILISSSHHSFPLHAMSYAMGFRGAAGRGLSLSSSAPTNISKRDQHLLNQLEKAFGFQCTLDQLVVPEIARQLLELVLSKLNGITATDLSDIVRSVSYSRITLQDYIDFFASQLQDLALIRASRFVLNDIGATEDAISVHELYKMNPNRMKQFIQITTRFALQTGQWINLRRDREIALDQLRQECDSILGQEKELQTAKSHILRFQDEERSKASDMRELIQKLQRERTSVLQRKQNLESEIDTLNADQVSIQDKMRITSKEIGIIREKVANNQRFIIDDPQSMRDSMKKLHEQVDKVRTDLAQLNQRRTIVQQQIGAYQEFIRDMGILAQRMGDSIQEKEQLAHIDMDYQASDTRLSGILDQITTAHKENEDLEENLTRSRDIAERARQLHMQQLTDLETTKADRSRSLIKESEECMNKTSRIHTLKDEFELLTSRIHAVNEDYDALIERMYTKMDSVQVDLTVTMDTFEEAVIHGSELGLLFN